MSLFTNINRLRQIYSVLCSRKRLTQTTSLLVKSKRVLSESTVEWPQVSPEKLDWHAIPEEKKYILNMEFIDPYKTEVLPAYRVMDRSGRVCDPKLEPSLDKEIVIKMYKCMIQLKTMDKILFSAQRHGRLSFYMTNQGEEGAVVASTAALNPNDLIFPQYREAGALMWRGYSLDSFISQCYGNADDPGKGRQMPILYGSRYLNFVTISSPLSTQLSQAAGAAYTYKRANNGLVVVSYLGDGGSSEGDVHPAFNFAATLKCPIIYICRNNAYAISTPTSEQYAGDGIVSRGPGYGMVSIRVDGNDVLAVYNTTKTARNIALSQSRPVLIEAMTNRIGPHSTSDDPTLYRDQAEVNTWMDQCAINRLRLYMTNKQWWNDHEEKELEKTSVNQVLEALDKADKKLKPNPKFLFSDVYKEMPQNLEEQWKELKGHIIKYSEHYPVEKYEGDEIDEEDS